MVLLHWHTVQTVAPDTTKSGGPLFEPSRVHLAYFACNGSVVWLPPPFFDWLPRVRVAAQQGVHLAWQGLAFA
eukprot:COSAG06_NODE_62059_length_266_cov_0.610778_1_plen_72_part_10